MLQKEARFEWRACTSSRRERIEEKRENRLVRAQDTNPKANKLPASAMGVTSVTCSSVNCFLQRRVCAKFVVKLKRRTNQPRRCCSELISGDGVSSLASPSPYHIHMRGQSESGSFTCKPKTKSSGLL